MIDDDAVQRRLARLTHAGGGLLTNAGGGLRAPADGGLRAPVDPVRPSDRDFGDPTGRSGPTDRDRADPAGSGDPLDLDDPAFPGATARLPAFDPGRRGVRALAAVAVVVVAVAALLAWRARPRVEPVPSADGTPVQGVPVPAVATGPSSEGRPAAAGTGTTGTGGPTQLIVAVTGRVRRPGLVTLPAGARVADALEAAGGTLPDTDIAWLNLARPVQDGELVVVGVTPPPGAVTGAAPAAGRPGETGKVDLNAASQQQLETLPGVGPVLAQRIIDHRERVGRFASVNDLRKVSGIGDARFDQLRELVTV
ncbi:competence protein ComEA [Micromonospora sp. Llam0]|uniref:helix-hairpin-helix domain-containing protein n=1 Tax=Micromonospora sp. Llam0 TaxID=2485143 RepID=UPI000FA1528D|nr:competence protein ComEA [Micromonospora sp. Llam0]